MNIQKQINELQSNAEGYATWGNIAIQYVGIKHQEEIYILDVFSNTASLISVVEHEDNLPLLAIKNILNERKNIHSVIVAKQAYGSKIKTEIPPILDDQAQLLGISIKMAHLKNTTADANVNAILAAIRNRYACIADDGLVYSIGNTLEDAYVAAWLVEKTSKAFLESNYLGGAKSINKIEAWLMHKFYMLKYSKESHKNK